MAKPLTERIARDSLARWALEVTAFALAAWVVAQTAVVAKQSRLSPPMVALDEVVPPAPTPRAPTQPPTMDMIAATLDPVVEIPSPALPSSFSSTPPAAPPADTYSPAAGFTRYFDGRPLRVKRTLWMTVTAYSPDARSCGAWADGRTATNTSVWTNAMSLVAADTRILSFGSIISVPGYSGGEAVPVLDRGGAIKGHRLDVLFPTHQAARGWGVRRVPVTVWEYADGRK